MEFAFTEDEVQEIIDRQRATIKTLEEQVQQLSIKTPLSTGFDNLQRTIVALTVDFIARAYGSTFPRAWLVKDEYHGPTDPQERAKRIEHRTKLISEVMEMLQ